MLPRRTFLSGLLASTLVAAESPDPRQQAAKRGRDFLAGLLDPELGLLPEFSGAKTYWLSHDNYLAAKVLATSHPEISRTLTASLQREGMAKTDGKTEMFFGPVQGVLPFRHFHLADVRRIGEKLIRTEVATDRPNEGWQSYADLLFLGSIAESNPTAARQHWEKAMKLWDGRGFADVVFPERKIYATYKLALGILAARRLMPPQNVPAAMIERLLALQADSGGWITDYNAEGKRIGLANVETSALAILALEALPPA